jgi:protein-tyrosine phosphatase
MIALFVCHANLNRSPRAAEVFRKLADQKGFNIEVQSAGTDAFFEGHDPQLLFRAFGVDHATQLTNEMLEKANIVIVLDDWVKREIETKYPIKPKRMISLGVPDSYSKKRNNFDELYEILNKKLEPLAEEISLLRRKPRSKETL